MTGAIVPYDFKRRREVVTPEGIAVPFVVATRAARFAQSVRSGAAAECLSDVARELTVKR